MSDYPVTPSEEEQPQVTFEGNNTDLVAFASIVTAIATLFVCGSMAYGAYCLPCAPILLGLIAVLNARRSVNPTNTRTYGWLSIGTGSLFFLLMALAVIGFALLYILMITLVLSNPEMR